ncbi:MAG TPA: hypothetical protein VFT56_07805 [Sphingomonas sp.]|nr:hypothetical protein [Sphingomonas sp.]
MLRPLLVLALVALPLAGCNDKPGASITLNAADEDGAVRMAGNGQTGEVAVNLPGFSGKLKLPKLHLDANDVEFNGVHLYPGSTVTAMNIDADHEDGVVRIAFDSPATPDAVRTWFQGKLTGAGFTLHADGDALAGKTNEDKPFRLELRPNSSDHAKGTITVG